MREVHVSEEIYTHEYLWRAAQSLHKQSAADEKTFYYRLASLIMTYIAFEAFVNFLGEVVCPEKWAIEKEAFRGRGDTIEAKVSDKTETRGTSYVAPVKRENEKNHLL